MADAGQQLLAQAGGTPDQPLALQVIIKYWAYIDSLDVCLVTPLPSSSVSGLWHVHHQTPPCTLSFQCIM